MGINNNMKEYVILVPSRSRAYRTESAHLLVPVGRYFQNCQCQIGEMSHSSHSHTEKIGF
jgi:hypothetical protein